MHKHSAHVIFLLATPGTSGAVEKCRLHTRPADITMFIRHSVFTGTFPTFDTMLVRAGNPVLALVAKLVRLILRQVETGQGEVGEQTGGRSEFSSLVIFAVELGMVFVLYL